MAGSRMGCRPAKIQVCDDSAVCNCRHTYFFIGGLLFCQTRLPARGVEQQANQFALRPNLRQEEGISISSEYESRDTRNGSGLGGGSHRRLIGPTIRATDGNNVESGRGIQQLFKAISA